MLNLKRALLFLFCIVVGVSQSALSQEQDSDYQIQGEYSGKLQSDGNEFGYGIQVVALGEGKFAGVGYMGGLPGDGWDKSEPIRVEEATLADGILTLPGEHADALIADGVASVATDDGEVIGRLKRVVRKSPTLGMKPPEGATVLFDGTSVDGWEFKGKPAKMTEDGLLMQGAQSKQKFQNHKIHIEFLLPYVPKARGQGRGNSGIYLQGRYEVQMLDSFGLKGEHNECGGVYMIRKPDVNMCFPPLQWQTYDIEYHAAEFDGDQKTKNAWMNVRHNGVTIHEKVELPKKTTAAPNVEDKEPGFIYLQDHGNPVRYRNIWVEELNGQPGKTEAEDDSDVNPNQTDKVLKVDHPIEMGYLLYLPKDYDANEKWPLVLFLHGAGERGDDLSQVKVHGPPKLAGQGKEFPFIVVSPQCKKNRWWEPVSLSALLDEIEKNYKVDASRIYVTGLSMGGFGTWDLASYSPERFAAIAPICGGGDSVRTAYTIGNQIPIWVFHGDKDRVVPISRSKDLIEAFEKKGVDVKFTVYPEVGHDSWTATYNNPELYEWLLAHSRN